MARNGGYRVDTERLMPTVLGTSAEEGARIIALHWLNALAENRARMVQPGATPVESAAPGAPSPSDDSAHLHKARVGLRRLRAVLREHRDILDIGKRLPKALKALNEATNSARDADVQRAWLGAEGDALGNGARKEAARLLGWLDAHVERDRRRVAKAFATHWDPIADELAARLSTYCEQMVVGRPPTRQSFAGSLATRLGNGAAEIENALTVIANDTDDTFVAAHDDESAADDDMPTTDANPLAGHSLERLHALRIRLKRQRALLAPFTSMNPAIGRWYELATRGQDALGAMRDASLLAELARDHDMPELEHAVQAAALGHYEAFHRGWCIDADAVARVSAAAVAAVATLDAIAAAGSLPREIERKYLLRDVPPLALTVAPVRIEQGWLPGSVLRERLRRAVRADGSAQLTRTVKAGSLGARIELEEHTTPELFETMWPHTRNARIRKHRHPVPDGGFVWEIDVFLDRELVLAEVELREGQRVPPAPEWLAPYIVRDVTDDPSYTNSSMATPDPAATNGQDARR